MNVRRVVPSVLILVASFGIVTACQTRPSPPATTQAAPASQPSRLRVMTYNIHHGAGEDGHVDLEQIARVIRDAKPDLVALQEVDLNTRRVPQDTVAELARLTGLHGRFGAAMPFEGGQYGQAILARWPIETFAVVGLPGREKTEPRIALVATFGAGAEVPPLRFIATHLHHQDEALRLEQLAAIGMAEKVAFSSPAPPSVLAGDLNAAPGSEVEAALERRWLDATPDDAPTYPATQPTQKIDWVLLSREHPWRVLNTQVIDAPLASDHRPVVVDLEITR